MSHRPVACRCDEACPVCRFGRTDAVSVQRHNEIVACHGERSYPGVRLREAAPLHWLEELIR